MGGEVMAAVWGLAGTVVGALASIGTTWLTNSHASKLEGIRTKEARVEAARAFQRQTLLELQAAVDTMHRVALENYVQMLVASDAGGEWGQTHRKDAPLNELYVATRTVGTLAQRVSDAQVRLGVSTFTSTLLAAATAPTRASAADAREKVMSEFPVLSTQMGACLRSHYDTQ